MGIKFLGRGSKLFKPAFWVLVVCVAAAGGYAYLRDGKQEINYRTSPVVRGDLVSTIQATGTLNPVETVDVGTQISGRIKQLFFDYNSEVEQGQLIALMDSATQEAEVDLAQANVDSAKADVLSAKASLIVAEKDLSRTQQLIKNDLVAKSELDKNQSTRDIAEAKLAAAQAKVEQYQATLQKTKINLNYTRIYSPVKGTVIAKNVEEGQTVAASYQTPSIAKIARDLTHMQVEINVDEADIGGVYNGQRAIFNVDAYPNEEFAGKVAQIRLAPQASDNVVTYVVVAQVANPDQKLIPGMTANVSLLLEHKDNVLTVPNSAFRFKPSDGLPNQMTANQGKKKDAATEVLGPAVYTLGKNKKPVRVEVEKGITDGENTEIISGINEGQQVITGIIVPRDGGR
ncbi:MAG: efflux RND transporter periplasmic adaptor subunit [Synergistes sp.]|nr:efflux RND transporter periplasmic adaptor subunit [Synergistes sp.]